MYKTIILLAVLSHLNSRWVGETRMEVFGNTMLRRIFASRDEEVTGSWRKMRKDEFYNFQVTIRQTCRSQCPRGLRHELSSPAQTLGSWVRIPLEAWMSVCIYSVFVMSCVQVVALLLSDPPSKESYWLCNKITKLKKRPKSNKGL
jgi:hypothetical protein